MANRNQTTTQRGLGNEHTKRRKQLPDPTGQPCPLCGNPMWPGQTPTGKTGRMLSNLDADHETPRALGGHNSPLRWTHRTCNRTAGAHLGNNLRHEQHTPSNNRSRDWT